VEQVSIAGIWFVAKSISTFESVFDGFKADTSFFSDQVKTITIQIKTAGTYNPITGETSGGTDTFYTAEGFRRDVKDKEFKDVQVGDMVFTCKQSDLGYKPKVNDKATIDTTVYTVVEVSDLGQVSYGIQLRG
jgi:hypothetical protein